MKKLIHDSKGNSIIVDNDGSKIGLSLSLRGEGRSRNIGFVDIQTKTLVVRRNRSKHLLRAGNAYGFNHCVLTAAKKFDKVRIEDEFKTWIIPVSEILERGSFLNFQKQGFELQIFVRLDILDEFAVS